MELSPTRSPGPKYFSQNFFKKKVKDRFFGSMHYSCLSRQILKNVNSIMYLYC